MADTQDKNVVPTIPVLGSQVDFKRDERTFVPGYANSVMVESNAFDLKLVFGLYDHRNPVKPVVDQFSSMTVSWPEVKLLIFWMQVHLAGYERENGKIKIPATALPPEPPATLPPPFDSAKAVEALESLRKMRAEFLANLAKP
jgi:hypothetical protein